MKARIIFGAVLSCVLFAPQACAELPAQFVHAIYAHYKNADPWAKGYDACKENCEADLARLVKAARSKHMIDYDPICQCRQGGGNYMLFSESKGATENDYTVKMKMLGDPRGGWTLQLRWVDRGWKIHDILETQNGKPVSLRQRLAGAMK
jgi:hypothetical protein